SECCHPGSTCLIGSRRLYMRADGVLLPCERVASNDTYFVIRDANNGIYLDKVKKKLDDFTQASDGECKNCWCFRMCNIGYLEGLVVNNKVESSKKSKDVWG
ncbi:MAG: SPASM domain-containing protein, partial [Chitinophagaceae bacterium]|nr:SPASM domain-containing protein [Chitinophagaceae bacterium]